MTAGTIVRSKAGHDKGLLFMVLAAEEPYLLLADGRSRKIEKPKKKKGKHAVAVGFEESVTAGEQAARLMCGGRELTNRELRGILSRFASCEQPRTAAGHKGG